MKPKYRVRNWSEYNHGLKQRGSLTFWIDEQVLSQWITTEKTGKKGASNTFSDQAIITFMTLKCLFQLAGRQTQGLLESLFSLMNIDLPVPDHSTVSRRMGKLQIKIPVTKQDQPRHVVIDSTGIKVYGEGEWKTRTYGVSKRRTWRKLHLAVDETSGEILVAEVTTNDYHDSEIFPELLSNIEGEIEQVSADGAYDTQGCYEQIEKEKAKATIPPQHNANKRKEKVLEQRNKTIERIEEVGRKQWKQESGYHRRSLSETAMFRLKKIFGGTLSSREFDNQAVELFIKCMMLNKMIQIGKPESYVVSEN